MRRHIPYTHRCMHEGMSHRTTHAPSSRPRRPCRCTPPAGGSPPVEEGRGFEKGAVLGGSNRPKQKLRPQIICLTLTPNRSPHLAATHASSSDRFISFDSGVKSRAYLCVCGWGKWVWAGPRARRAATHIQQRQQDRRNVRSASPSRSCLRPPAPAARSAPATCPHGYAGGCVLAGLLLATSDESCAASCLLLGRLA